MSVWTSPPRYDDAPAAGMESAATPRAPHVLTLTGVNKHYGGILAVGDLDLEVRDGELLTVVGPSGCGKSTTLRLVAGLDRPDAGEIRVADEVVASRSAWRPAERRRVGLVFQDHALFPHLTVTGNVAFGLDRWSAGRRRTRVTEVLELVQLGALAGRFPQELSGGEQQRVALARALAPEPAVVLLDEPFSNLDRNLRNQIRDDTVAVLRQTGTTGVLVTHDQGEALAFGERVAVMRGGRIEQVGTPEEVFHSPANRFVATFMGEADFLPGRRVGSDICTEVGPVPAPAGLPSEQPAEVMLRPHEVTLHPDAGGGGDGRVVGSEFQGGFHLYTVELASGRRLRSLQPHTTTYPIGSVVGVELTPGHVPAVLVDGRAIQHFAAAGSC